MSEIVSGGERRLARPEIALAALVFVNLRVFYFVCRVRSADACKPRHSCEFRSS